MGAEMIDPVRQRPADADYGGLPDEAGDPDDA